MYKNIDIVTVDNENKCSFSIVYIVCIVLILAICIGIGIYLVFYHCYLKKYSARSVFNIRKETLIY